MINLIRRYLGMSVPGVASRGAVDSIDFDVPGGTYCWYKYLKKKNVLKIFDYKLSYPIGTLLIRPYFSENDQAPPGEDHLAILLGNDLYSPIIHCLSDLPLTKDVLLQPGVTKRYTLRQSHFYHSDGYYKFYCLAEDWLIE